MRAFYIFFISIWLTIFNWVYAQAPDTLWTKTFGGEDWDWGNCVQQTVDGGFVITGVKDYSQGGGGSGVYLIKANDNGDLIWEKSIGEDNRYDRGEFVEQTTDGGFIIAGIKKMSALALDYDVYLIKTNSEGDVTWRKTFGGQNEDFGYCVRQTSDGGYIIAGWTSAGNDDFLLIKTNANGELIWSKTFGGSQTHEKAYYIDLTNDGGYIIAGYTEIVSGPKDIYIVKTDEDGIVLWENIYNLSTSDDIAHSIEQTTDGGFVFTGETRLGPSTIDILLYKINGNGDSLWVKTFGWGSVNRGYSVKQTTDGGFILTGTGNPFSSYNLVIIKTDEAGDSIWTKAFENTPGSSNNDYGYSVRQTLDEGYIITGWRDVGVSLDTQVWLIRLDEYIPSNVSVEQPNGGENWQVGMQENILWNAENVEYVNIEYSTDAGSTWVTPAIATNYDATLESFTWTIPDTPSVDCLVRILDSSNPEVGDTSDGTFIILAAPVPYITITSPTGGETWKVENTDTISWNSEYVTNVIIEYSTNDGLNWVEVVDSWPASPGSYSWTIPNETSAECKVKVSDVSNPSTVNSISNQLTLRGYTLVRDVNGVMDIYSMSDDGWSFDNIEENMWPQVWWGEFDYNPLNDYLPYWMQLIITSQTFPDWWLYTDAFIDQCYFPGTEKPRTKAIFKWFWLSYPSLSLSTGLKYWQGSCFGFAISSFLFYNHKDQFLAKFEELLNYPNLDDYSINVETRNVINELWIYLDGKEHTAYMNGKRDWTPNETLSQIKQMLKDDVENERVLNIDNQLSSGKHTVNPYKVYSHETNPEIEYIVVYDNNDNGPTKKIEINTTQNSWTYITTQFKTWGGNKGLYLMEPVSQYLDNPTLKSDNDLNATKDNSLLASNYLEFYNTPNASILIEDAATNTIQFADSIIVNSLPSGIPIIPSTGKYHPPIGYFIPNDQYSITMSEVQDSLTYLSVLFDSLSYNYQRNNPDVGQVDKFYYGNSFSFVNPDVEDKNFWFGTIISEDTSDKQFIVDECIYQQNDSLQFESINPDELEFVNWGGDKYYNLKLRIVGPATNDYFENNHINIPTNTSHQIVPDWTDIVNQSVVIYVDIGNDGTIEDTLEITNQTFQLSVSVSNDWNLVSVPGLHPTNQDVTTWWSNLTGSVFKYTGQYQAITEAVPTEGYWMKHIGANVYETGDEWPAGGIQIVPHDPIAGASGWNLIGGYEDTVLTSGLTTTPPGLIDGLVWGYRAGPGYHRADTLVPGYGYWIKLLAAGLINIPPEPINKGTEEIVEYFKDDWGKIIITDNDGRSYTLYAVKGEVDLNNYELPPMPPAGMFDIRYGSGRIAEDISNNTQSIDMTGIEYPITVKVENIDIRLQDKTGKQINENLKSGEEISISNAQINKLMVTGEMIPDVYSLEQNYPNPFNPSTVIEFSLPEDVNNVQLTIYDVLGQRVTQLVNTSLQAGRYSYQWNGGTVATGMYIYELRADKFVSVKKMILMK